ncbi:serpin family protein [Thermophilibacter sp.]
MGAQVFSAPFDPGRTEDATFTREDGTERTAHMMHATEGLYLESDLATGFIKSYADDELAFVGLLPREGTSVSDLVSDLDGASLRSLLLPVDNTIVHIGLPRLELTYENGLANDLRALGMTGAFDPELANFSPMGSSDDGPLYVGEVLHKTHVEVDEEGTRAAAATEVEMLSGASALSDPPQEREVILDRPFVFLIVDQRTETPVFIGTVMDV